MPNSTRLLVSDTLFWGSMVLVWAALGLSLGLMISACLRVPHDFGMYNNLKTICHVWKGRDGFRRQATMHINSSKNIHGAHPWDYDGKCEE